jgi:tetratricopeptide (TPR) repeat protein
MATQSDSAASDVQILLEIAESLLGDGDPAGALQVFTDVLAAEPRNVHALVGKARALMSLDRDEQALRFLELATTAEPELAPSWMLLGTAALATGNGEAAARAFAQAQRLGVAPSESYLNLARAAYFALDLEKARDYAQLALTEDPGSEDARSWSEALGGIADYAAFLVDVGRAHCRRGRFETGLELLLRSLEEKETFAAHLFAGRALLALQRLAEAETHLNAALELQPRDVEVLNDLATTMAFAGRDTDALTTLDDLLAVDPENVDGLTTRARLLLRAGDTPAATPVIERLIATATERPDTWLLEAWRLKSAGRGKRARLATEHAVALDALNAPPWLEAGAILAELGDAAAAELCRARYLYLIEEEDTASRPDSGTLREVQVESRELDEMELKPDELAQAWRDRAIFYSALGELERAAMYLDRLVAELPQYETAEVAYQRGVLLMRLGDSERARAAFERALHIDASSEATRIALAELDASSPSR